MKNIKVYIVQRHHVYTASILFAIILGLKHKMKTRLSKQKSKHIKE